MEHSPKQVDSFIKIFELLKLLLEDNAKFSQVISVISEDGMPVTPDSSNHSVTLSKYLNTLRLFGLNVKKEKGKYHLINPPYKVELNQEELEAFTLIKQYASEFENDEKGQEEFDKFLKAFELRFSEKTQMLAKTKESTNRADFSFYYDNITNKLDLCSKFCREDYKVEIIYYPNSKKIEKKIYAKLKGILHRKNSILLEALDLGSRQMLTISLNKIISIKQLPCKTDSQYSIDKSVVYGIRGRLEKNYRMREWENHTGSRDGWKVITNKGEDEEELIKRLLRYGDLCRVFSTESFRNKLIERLDATLKLYED